MVNCFRTILVILAVQFVVYGYESEIIHRLNQHLIQKGYKKIEGHIYNNNTSQPQYFKSLFEKYPEIKKVTEIGFNAGHSSIIYLENLPDVQVVSFDIGRHEYVYCGKLFIDQLFPHQHVLILGDSAHSVYSFYLNNPDKKFDFIFIDGRHSYQAALQDIKNMSLLAHKDTLVIVDDLQGKGVERAFDEAIKEGLIECLDVQRSKQKQWALCKFLGKN